MRPNKEERLEQAREALRANRNLSKLGVYPGPRGKDTKAPCDIRRRGRHLHWYIGEFQHRPGISGPVRCEEVPTFRTERAAKEFLATVKGSAS